jgi:hypothetical protein
MKLLKFSYPGLAAKYIPVLDVANIVIGYSLTSDKSILNFHNIIAIMLAEFSAISKGTGLLVKMHKNWQVQS